MTRPQETPASDAESEPLFAPLDHFPDATDAEQRELSRLVLINNYTVDDVVQHIRNERARADHGEA